MSAESIYRVRGMSLLLMICLLGLPWLGWVYFPSATALHLALANMGVAVVVAVTVHSFHQAMIALAARTLGDRVPLVSVGVGPALWSRTVGQRSLAIPRATAAGEPLRRL
jgi:hypothetical protein